MVDEFISPMIVVEVLYICRDPLHTAQSSHRVSLASGYPAKENKESKCSRDSVCAIFICLLCSLLQHIAKQCQSWATSRHLTTEAADSRLRLGECSQSSDTLGSVLSQVIPWVVFTVKSYLGECSQSSHTLGSVHSQVIPWGVFTVKSYLGECSSHTLGSVHSQVIPWGVFTVKSYLGECSQLSHSSDLTHY